MNNIIDNNMNNTNINMNNIYANVNVNSMCLELPVEEKTIIEENDIEKNENVFEGTVQGKEDIPTNQLKTKTKDKKKSPKKIRTNSKNDPEVMKKIEKIREEGVKQGLTEKQIKNRIRNRNSNNEKSASFEKQLKEEIVLIVAMMLMGITFKINFGRIGGNTKNLHPFDILSIDNPFSQENVFAKRENTSKGMNINRVTNAMIEFLQRKNFGFKFHKNVTGSDNKFPFFESITIPESVQSIEIQERVGQTFDLDDIKAIGSDVYNKTFGPFKQRNYQKKMTKDNYQGKVFILDSTFILNPKEQYNEVVMKFINSMKQFLQKYLEQLR